MRWLSARGLSARRLLGRPTKRRVYFVRPGPHLTSGSTILRSHQLRDIARMVPELADVRIEVTSERDQRDSVLIFNKNALEISHPDEIERIKARGNYMLADPLDGAFDDALLSAFDTIIAASKQQFASYTSHFPQRVAFVGHHVDTRIQAVRPSPDGLSMGYFGERVNALYSADLADRVSFVNTDTGHGLDTRWMADLRRCNAHYALRSKTPLLGFIPFTKGFIAAHCGAPILVADHDLEARHYLPEAYPYVTATDSLAAVRRTIERMADEYGSRNWEQALDIMRDVRAACAVALVAAQLHAALRVAL